MAKQLATQMAPPFNLVAHYFIAGAFFYILTSMVLPFYAGELGDFAVSTKLAALSHLYLLGFVMMIIFGAMYQLIPVILEIPLFSKDFAYIQFYLFLSGLLIMVYAFFDESSFLFLPYGSLLVLVSMLIFSVNVFLTYKNIERWSVTAKYIFVSNIFLFVGVVLGFLAALNLEYGFLKIDILKIVIPHIFAVLAGYVMMTVMGVALVLIPMFSLAYGFDQKAIQNGFYFISVGVPLFIYAVLADIFWLEAAGFVCVVISFALFAYQMRLIYKSRVRKQNDYWAKNMTASFIFFILSVTLFLLSYFLGWQRGVLFGGYLFFFGFLATIIVGHIYKILPFLVWYQRYSALVGKQKVPMLHDMVVEKVADIQFWLTLAGIVISSIGVLFSVNVLFIAGAAVMAFSAFLVLYNIYFTLTYKKV